VGFEIPEKKEEQEAESFAGIIMRKSG